MSISAPLTEPTLITLEAQPAAVVRHRGVTMANLTTLFDTGFAAIVASGAPLAGPPFALYHGDPNVQLDLDLGFPVSAPLTGPIEGDITVEPFELPAGQALAVSHFGAYESLGGAWGQLGGEALSRGLQPSAWFEVYVTEPRPDMDPATLRTDLYLLV